MPDQETIKQLVGLSAPIQKNTLNPEMSVDAETGEMFDLEASRNKILEDHQTIEKDSQEPAKEPVESVEPVEIEFQETDNTHLLHYTKDTQDESVFANDPRYLRIDNFPSKFVAYDFSHVFARTLQIDDWVGLTRAVNRENITEFIDVFDATLSVSIRDLAYQDFIWFMYWHMLCSFPQQSINISWMSRYGNRNTTSVKTTSIENKEIEITQEEYQNLNEEGYRLPLVRDYEILMSGLLTQDQETKYRIAQYFDLGINYPNQKAEIESFVTDSLNAISSMETKAMSRFISEIHTKFTFGISNSVELVDESFELEAWKQQIQRGIDLLAKNPHRDQRTYNLLQNQLAEIERREEAGEDLSQPSPEKIDLEFSPWGFFPNVPQ